FGAQCASAVTVVDTTPPTIASLSLSPSRLWPPNKRMVPVTVSVQSQDLCDTAAPSCRIVSVTSNEAVVPSSGWHVTPPLGLTLLADREGVGSGRVYTVTVACHDHAGNVTRRSATVTVPHDNR